MTNHTLEHLQNLLELHIMQHTTEMNKVNLTLDEQNKEICELRKQLARSQKHVDVLDDGLTEVITYLVEKHNISFDDFLPFKKVA